MTSRACRLVSGMLGLGLLIGFTARASATGKDDTIPVPIPVTIAPDAAAEPASAPPKPLPPDITRTNPIRPLSNDFKTQTIRWDIPVRPRPKLSPTTPSVKDDELVSRADFLKDSAAVNPPPAVKADPSFVDSYFDRPEELLDFWLNDSTFFRLEGIFRGYYRNDQRIRWSGVEDTFGAEGDLRPSLWNTQGDWTVSAEGEFFLNMPYGAVLDTRKIHQYQGNFQVNTFDIFQLYTQADWGNWRFRLGKTRTPFGNFRVPMYSNSLFDAPFIRTDVIPFTEVGAFGHYQDDWVLADFGVVNGEQNLDTNSSKGFIGRLAIDRPNWTLGISDKSQDGTGSEFQKRRNSIQGVDASARHGRWVVYGEATRDEYGFNHDFNKFGNYSSLGVRSLYGRDVYVPGGLVGWGYYAGFGYRGEKLLVDLNYGSYQPQHIGNPVQDSAIVRAVIKGDYALTPHLHLFAVSLIENRRPRDGVLDAYNPWAVTTGFQFVF